MSDTRGGLVRFTRLNRNYISDGVYELVAAGNLWMPERSFRLEPATHDQPGGGTITFATATMLQGGERFEVQETVDAALTRQEAGLEQTRPTTGNIP